MYADIFGTIPIAEAFGDIHRSLCGGNYFGRIRVQWYLMVDNLKKRPSKSRYIILHCKSYLFPAA